jgi:hypothetical protein
VKLKGSTLEPVWAQVDSLVMRLCDPFSEWLLTSLLLPQLSAINFQSSLQSVHLEDLLSTFRTFGRVLYYRLCSGHFDKNLT